MNGVIIAGGLGTRLRPLTYERPKPLAPLAGRPFLEYQVALLRAHGVDNIVFATNYMAERIEQHFGDGARFGVRMRYAVEDRPLGTGGAIRNAAELFPGSAVCVFNGDILTDFDLSEVIRVHRERRASATITLAEVPRPNPFGALTLDAEGRVLAWDEPSEATKRALAAAGAQENLGVSLINAGFYVLEPEMIAHIPLGAPSSIERDIYPRMIAEQRGIYGYVPGGFWLDVGRPDQLLAASTAVLAGRVLTQTPPIPLGEQSDVAASARVGATSAIGRLCHVGEDAIVEDAILMDGVVVGDRCEVRNAILDNGATLEADTRLAGSAPRSPAVVAAGSHLRRGTQI